MTIRFVAGRSKSLQTEIETHIPQNLSSLHLASGFFSERGAKFLEHLILSNSSSLKQIWIIVGWSTLGGLRGLANIKDEVNLWSPHRHVSLNIALDLGKCRTNGSAVYNQMHSKLLAASSVQELFGVIGSSNYTKNGLGDQANEEANLLFKTNATDSSSGLVGEISNEVERLVGIATDFDTRKILTYAQHYKKLAKNFCFFPESKGDPIKDELIDSVHLSGFLELDQTSGSPWFTKGQRIFFDRANEIKNPKAIIFVRLLYSGKPTDKCLVVRVENSQTGDNTVTDNCDWEADVSSNSVKQISTSNQLRRTPPYSAYSGIIEKITSIYSVSWCDRFKTPEAVLGDELIKVRLASDVTPDDRDIESGQQVIDVEQSNANWQMLADLLDRTPNTSTIGRGVIRLFEEDEEVEVGINKSWDESAEYNQDYKKYVKYY